MSLFSKRKPPFELKNHKAAHKKWQRILVVPGNSKVVDALATEQINQLGWYCLLDEEIQEYQELIDLLTAHDDFLANVRTQNDKYDQQYSLLVAETKNMIDHWKTRIGEKRKTQSILADLTKGINFSDAT